MKEKAEILLAEDEEHIAKLVEFKLNREGYSVFITRNGQEAIDQFGTRVWSLFILDIMMPIRDGWEVLQALRASQWSNIPVLMLTAKGSQKDLSFAAELGATQFLRKPFDPDELAARVRRILES